MKEDEVSTVVGSGVHLTGTLKDQSDIVVNGSVEGEVNSDQNIVVGESAKVKGPVTAQLVSVSGEVNGTITAKDKLEIHPSGKVEGNIKTKDLIIHSGAIFIGKCDMKTEAPESDIDVPDLGAEDEEDESEETEKEKDKEDEEEDGEKIEIEA